MRPPVRPHVEKKKEDHMDIELEWLQATLNDASEALQDALQKIINDSNGGLICIII